MAGSSRYLLFKDVVLRPSASALPRSLLEKQISNPTPGLLDWTLNFNSMLRQCYGFELLILWVLILKFEKHTLDQWFSVLSFNQYISITWKPVRNANSQKKKKRKKKKCKFSNFIPDLIKNSRCGAQQSTLMTSM